MSNIKQIWLLQNTSPDSEDDDYMNVIWSADADCEAIYSGYKIIGQYREVTANSLDEVQVLKAALMAVLIEYECAKEVLPAYYQARAALASVGQKE